MDKVKLAKNLMNFIDESPCNYFACISARKILQEKGYTELFESETWKLKKGGKYFLTINKRRKKLIICQKKVASIDIIGTIFYLLSLN